MNNAWIRSLLVGVFLIMGTKLHAGKLEKAFEALQEYNYFKARGLFQESVKKEPVGANYGLSVIYGRDDNPFYNLDSAYKCISIADTSFPNLKDKAKEELKELGVNDTILRNWKDSIDLKAFHQAKFQNTVKSFQAYIDLHLDSDWRNRMVEIRDSVELRSAMKTNRSVDYKSFLEKYPNSIYKDEAQERFEARSFYETVEKNREQHYERFIKENPSSPFLKRAQDSLYAISTSAKTQPAYYNFIKKYKNNPNVNTAWRNLYKLYTASYSPTRIQEFKEEYPDYPFMNELDIFIELAAKKFYRFKKNGLWGFMDEAGKVRVPAVYDVVEPYSEGLALVQKNKKIGFIDQAGREVIPREYDDGESFNEGLAIVSKGDYFGMVDRTNKVVIPIKYDIVSQFYKGLALVADANGYGFINNKGEIILDPFLSFASDFKNGFSIVENEGKKGIIDYKGEFIIPVKYEWLRTFNNEPLFLTKSNAFYGVLDAKGEIVVPFEYDRIGEYNCGLAIAAKNGKYGYVNTKGEIIIPIKYDYSQATLIWGNFEDCYAKYMRNDKFGIIDTSGKEIFPAIFENINGYSTDQHIAVKKRGKWGYSNQKLSLTIPYDFDFAYTFKQNRGVIKKGDKLGLVNEKGKYILPPEYSLLERLNDSLLIVKKEKVGIVNIDGEIIVSLDYDDIEFSSYDELLALTKGEELFYYNFNKDTYFKPN